MHLVMVGYKTYGDLNRLWKKGEVIEVDDAEGKSLLMLMNASQQPVFLRADAPAEQPQAAAPVEQPKEEVAVPDQTSEEVSIAPPPPPVTQPTKSTKKTFVIGKKAKAPELTKEEVNPHRTDDGDTVEV